MARCLVVQQEWKRGHAKGAEDAERKAGYNRVCEIGRQGDQLIPSLRDGSLQRSTDTGGLRWPIGKLKRIGEDTLVCVDTQTGWGFLGEGGS